MLTSGRKRVHLSIFLAGLRLLAAAPLPFLPLASLNSISPEPATQHPEVAISLQFVAPIVQPNYDQEVLTPLHEAEARAAALAAAEAARLAKLQSDCAATGGTLDGETCVPPPPPPLPPAPVYEAPVVSYQPMSIGELAGALGYALAGGNCVNEPGVNNPGWGNPIEWPVTSGVPQIGATVLFWFNHTAVVSGLWSNGDIEVRHQNCAGCPTRYPRSMIRGYR